MIEGISASHSRIQAYNYNGKFDKPVGTAGNV
eukprot:CAMPEP_0176348124 /NCGR_PEP_ID=MMETSP0126-20121128/7619_1 /TAXON_ID=141414 ORGANISM="Strombidinopsis acuminatum, Strain SPMC142" /NCGR_SAMPLE_ID=MMETSP0126 /ASSEMBLY_ACC=CAM_ASM_000229 /LENGTH=31 /DNA_ID= /DNA_START= /DNA_END= /DNA_ORIENTATION=